MPVWRAGVVWRSTTWSKMSFPTVPTDTPGVTAWLHLELQQYFGGKGEFGQNEDAFFVDWQDHRLMPTIFEPLSQLLIQPQIERIESLDNLSFAEADLEDAGMEATYFRSQSLLHYGADIFVNTTRKGTVTDQIDDFQVPSHRFLHASLPHPQRHQTKALQSSRLDACEKPLSPGSSLHALRKRYAHHLAIGHTWQ